MEAMNEKKAFSERLLQAMHQAKIQVRSPTRLTLEFNLRYTGKPVTTQAVRKWLCGEAIPSQDKILTLANWLNISTEWLRFGETTYTRGRPEKNISVTQEKPDYPLLNDELYLYFNKLSEESKRIIREMALNLLRLEKKEK